MRQLLLTLLLLGFASGVSAQVPSDAQLRELIVVSGMREMMQASLDQGLTAFPSGTPVRFIELFKEEIKLDSLLFPIMALYRSRLTAAEVGQLIQFYQSPTGKKMMQIQPEMVVASQQLGRAYGERAGKRALARFQAEQQALLKKDD